MLQQTLVRSARKDSLQILLVSNFIGKTSVGVFRFFAIPNLKSKSYDEAGIVPEKTLSQSGLFLLGTRSPPQEIIPHTHEDSERRRIRIRIGPNLGFENL